MRSISPRVGFWRLFRVYNAHDLLGILAPMLEGEIERSEGSLDLAISAFTCAVAQYDALMYDEPERFRAPDRPEARPPPA